MNFPLGKWRIIFRNPGHYFYLFLWPYNATPLQLFSHQMMFWTHRIRMYGIYGNIYHQYIPNVSIYTIHGHYGETNPDIKMHPYQINDYHQRSSNLSWMTKPNDIPPWYHQCSSVLLAKNHQLNQTMKPRSSHFFRAANVQLLQHLKSSGATQQRRQGAGGQGEVDWM